MSTRKPRLRIAFILLSMMLAALLVYGCAGPAAPAPAKQEPAKTAPAPSTEKQEAPKTTPAQKEEPKPTPAPAKPAASAPTKVLKLGTIHAPDSTRAKAMQKFAELVGQKTGGSIKVEVYPASQIGTDKQMTEMITLGTLDMHYGGAITYLAQEAKIGVLMVPFLLRDYDHQQKVWASPVGQELRDAMVKKNVRPLMWYDGGRRFIYSTKKPIRGPQDMAGMKMRVPEIKLVVETWKMMGASPTAIAAAEVFTALQQGLVEATEGPPDVFLGLGLGEVVKFISLTNHWLTPDALNINEKVWQGLSADVQKSISAAAAEVEGPLHQSVAKAEDDALDKFKAKGAQIITDPDKNAFAQKMPAVISQFENEWGKGMTDRITAVK